MAKNYNNKILQGDSLEVLKSLPDNLVDMVITSPPYWGLRNYGKEGQLGQESDYHEYIEKLYGIMNECGRVLKGNGSLWVNLGDSYCGTGDKGNYKDPKYPNGRNGQTVSMNRIIDGIKQKSLVGIPDRFKIKMIDSGWLCRNEIIWYKPNQMPSSAKDRFTVDFEKFYFFTKNRKYYFEQQLEPYTAPMNRWGGVKLTATNESDWDKGTGQETYRDRNMRPNPNGRNKRCVWSINTKPLKEAHFAVYPEELVETPIKACCPENGLVMDIFFGSGTTGVVAKKLNRNYLGIELNPEYIKIAEKRLEFAC